mmetsp:Transcript_61376/g.182876  ORF Transcript_61376/g.182876 Transcript_61376/m.182876 type:complete len:308 (-) Transcript_61376:516-1439(-)
MRRRLVSPPRSLLRPPRRRREAWRETTTPARRSSLPPLARVATARVGQAHPPDLALNACLGVRLEAVRSGLGVHPGEVQGVLELPASHEPRASRDTRRSCLRQGQRQCPVLVLLPQLLHQPHGVRAALRVRQVVVPAWAVAVGRVRALELPHHVLGPEPAQLDAEPARARPLVAPEGGGVGGLQQCEPRHVLVPALRDAAGLLVAEDAPATAGSDRPDVRVRAEGLAACDARGLHRPEVLLTAATGEDADRKVLVGTAARIRADGVPAGAAPRQVRASRRLARRPLLRSMRLLVSHATVRKHMLPHS